MKLYFMGICGTAMGNAAILMRRLGYDVCGADTGVYPPMSEILAAAGIAVLEGYDPQRLQKLQPDRVVVGNVISRGNPEVEWLWETRAFPHISLPALLHELLLSKRKNIVVTGTHGKTTTATLAGYLLSQNGCNPGYLIGGVPVNLPSGAAPGNETGPFVIEGDEYDSAFFDKRSKFIHYAPHLLVVNNLEFDHADIFRDLADIIRSFNHVLRIVPRNGYVVLNGEDDAVAQLDKTTWTPTVRVGQGKHNDLRIRDFVEHRDGSSFELLWQGKLWSRVEWGLSGFFNAQNAAMAALSAGLLLYGDTPQHLQLSGLEQFNGVRRRQDNVYSSDALQVFEDFGHHPTAIEKTLTSLRNRFPGFQVTACFEPRSNTARTAIFQNEFTHALNVADSIFIGPVNRMDKMDTANCLNTKAMAADLVNSGKYAIACASNAAVLDELQTHVNVENPAEKHLVCFFSNGSFDGIMRRYVTSVQEIIRQ